MLHLDKLHHLAVFQIALVVVMATVLRLLGIVSLVVIPGTVVLSPWTLVTAGLVESNLLFVHWIHVDDHQYTSLGIDGTVF